METITIQKKPILKSLTVLASSTTIIWLLITCITLSVKPAEQLIEHGHLKYSQLIPSTVAFILMQCLAIYGRIRKGDLT